MFAIRNRKLNGNKSLRMVNRAEKRTKLPANETEAVHLDFDDHLYLDMGMFMVSVIGNSE